MTDLQALLALNPYPGRGVLCARTHSGAVRGGYFLSGRSAASKDRALRVDGDGLVAGPLTPAEHDPLRYYMAALSTAGWLVFGNGEHVAHVTGRLRKGASAADSLGGLEYEPDPPIRTSRIAALLSRDGDRTAVLGAARPSSGSRLSANVMTLTVQGLEPGEAVLMTTYHSDGQTVLTAAPFEETTVSAHDGIDLLEEIWSALNPEFRVAVAVLDPRRGPTGTVLRSA
jgi:IMP cyclohydrolase